MAKTQQTLEIEQTLERVCRERRIYGCKEVTIGFPIIIWEGKSATL